MDFVAVILFTQQVFHLECLFLFTYFDTWDCYYFGLNPSLVLLIKVSFIKQHVMLFFSLLKMKKQLCHLSLVLYLSGISLERYCRKSPAKSEGFRKRIKRGNGRIWGVVTFVQLKKVKNTHKRVLLLVKLF